MGTQVLLIQPGDEVVVPRGNTVFKEHDRITIIGKAMDIQALYKKYRDVALRG